MRTVVFDCRWLGWGGPGRVTELLLRGLADTEIPFRPVLWGPPTVEDMAWPGAEVITTAASPRVWSGQRGWYSIPSADLVVFLHHLRPLRRVASVTFLYDTIMLRTAHGRVDREVKALFMRRVPAVSKSLITLSEYSRRCIEDDLGVPAGMITVLGLPTDGRLAGRVLGLRQGRRPSPTALYVGRFAAHKNLPRLARAFGRTAFAASGGRLLLVGGTEEEVADLWRALSAPDREHVDIRPRCSQHELEQLLATSLFLVQPSLEEGFGLPAWEALTCGLPVCASTGGALEEVTMGMARTFPPTADRAMAGAIDACADDARHRSEDELAAASEAFCSKAPSVTEFADAVVGALDPHLR